MNAFFARLTAVTLFLAAGASVTSACKCARLGFAERTQPAVAVFLAEALAERQLDKPIDTKYGRLTRTVQLQTIEQFKGKRAKKFWVNDFSDAEAGCGANFRVGGRFVVFMAESKPVAISQCDVEGVQDLTAEQREELRFADKVIARKHEQQRSTASSEQLYLEGVIAYQKGSYADAKRDWEESLLRDPSNNDSRTGLAKLKKLMQKGAAK